MKMVKLPRLFILIPLLVSLVASAPAAARSGAETKAPVPSRAAPIQAPAAVQAGMPTSNNPVPGEPNTTKWYDGGIQYSTIINCASIILGTPYTEAGVGTYVGFRADLDTGQPTPNQTYYIHIVIAGMGNACSGE
jgi:hypothetical protein